MATYWRVERLADERFPHASAARLRTALHRLREEGLLRREGSGPGTVWVRIGRAQADRHGGQPGQDT